MKSSPHIDNRNGWPVSSQGKFLFCLCAALVTLLLPPHVAAAPSKEAAPYRWRNVTIGGGGFVTGMVFHPAATNLMYARTDVGGAYRWDDAANRWTPITDWLGPADNNLMGIESIALDDSDPARVYLAAGTYFGGPAAILRSKDQGRTFQKASVPFKMGGNEIGRFNGERLAVDPNDGNILLFGSRRDGLWQSRDAAVTWQRVAAFSALEPSALDVAYGRPRSRRGGAQSVGIVSVVFDAASGRPGEPTPRIFAAVSTVETNFLSSTNAGASWQPVGGQPLGLCPNHVVRSPDGLLYLTYGREPGPNTMTDGAVWRFDPRDNSWTDITPLKPRDAPDTFGYGAVAVDARHPATVMVATFAHWHPHDLIFRSVDGGAHWSQVWRDDTTWDSAFAPYTRAHHPHWMGSLVINPRNSANVLFGTGYGIWSCANMTDSDAGLPLRWTFLDQGLEETVPLALVSPGEGPHLLSGVGDIDGFRHDDLTASPASGSFSGPRFVNTQDLAVAGKNPNIIVRTGTVDNQDVRAAISRDGGLTWQELESEPPTGEGAGTIAISADASSIVWTPVHGEPYLTRDFGSNWVACGGLTFGARVVADAVNPLKFYAFVPGTGKFCVSVNGGASFEAGTRILPAENGYNFEDAEIGVSPGTEGEVWLAARAAGLFHSTNSGARFGKIPRVQAADSLGQGRPAPGKSRPALYLAGTVEGVAALFRSDDDGVSWMRINDEQHQYGFIGHVTGDPRIFGRVYFATGGRGIIYGDPNDSEAIGKN